MSMTTVGYAALQVVPSVKGIKEGLSKAVTQPMESEGKAAGSRFGGAWSKAALGLVAGGVAAVTGLFKAGEAFTAVTDTIIVGTGAAGSALEGLKASGRTIAQSVPADMQSIGTAVADLNTRLDLTGPQLETMAGKFLNLSRITGTDLAGNIGAVSRVFGDWGITTDGQAVALDKIFEATKRTGIGLDRLTTLTVQYGAPLRQLGFSFEETLALFGKFEKEGVNTETVFAGLRMGLSKMAMAGEAPVETFKRVTEEIKAAGTTGEANALALEAFGSRAGPDLAAAIREGRLELGDMVAALENSEGSLDDASGRTMHFSEQWQIFKNKALLQIEPVATRVFGVFTRGMEWLNSTGVPVLRELYNRFKPFVSDLMAELAPMARQAFEALKPMVEDGLAKLETALTWVGTHGVPALKDLARWGRDNIGWIKPMAGVVLGLVAAWKVGTAVAAGYRAAVAGLAAVKALLNSRVVQLVRKYAILAAAKAKDLAQTVALSAMYARDAVRSALANAAALGRVAVAYAAVALAKVRDVAAMAAHTAAMVAQRVAMMAVRGAMLIATAAQWAWNAALSANPIGLIIAAIAALVAAVVWLWNNNEGFRTFVIAAWEGIKAAVAVVVSWFQEHVLPVLVAAWEGIKAAVAAVVDWFQKYVQPVISAVWSAIVAYVRTLWTVYSTVWNAVWDIIRAVVTWITGTMWPALRGAFESVNAKVRSVWDAVSSAFTSVLEFVRGIPGKIKAALVNAATLLVTRGREFITGLWDGIKARWEAARDWFGGLGDRIKGAFANASRLLWDAGRNIMTGLWDGLKSGWERVTGWVGGLGSWIADNKGPKAYDLKLLQPAGRWIMDGLRTGLESQIPALRGTLGTVSDALAIDAQLQAALNGAGPASAGGSVSKTLNYYAAPGAQVSGEDGLAHAMDSARMVGW